MCLTIPHELLGAGSLVSRLHAGQRRRGPGAPGRRPRRLPASPSDGRRRRAHGRPHASGRPERAGDLRARQRLEPAQSAQPRRRRGAQRRRLRDAAVRPADRGRSAAARAGVRHPAPGAPARGSLRAGRSRTHGRDELPIGYFGASTGAAAALRAAAAVGDVVGAVVSRGGRPDLAADRLAQVRAPTLLLVGSRDRQVLELNRHAAAMLRCPHQLMIVEGAGHLFEEPGALDAVARAAPPGSASTFAPRRRPWRPRGADHGRLRPCHSGERAIVDAIRREAHPLTGDVRRLRRAARADRRRALRAARRGDARHARVLPRCAPSSPSG